MVDEEIRNRIKLSVAAFAYEFRDDPIMSDAEFDALSLKIDPKKSTGNDLIDNFFRTHFDPNTGVWVHNHPELWKVQQLYRRYYRRSS